MEGDTCKKQDLTAAYFFQHGLSQIVAFLYLIFLKEIIKLFKIRKGRKNV
jgi:hypothetical protein